MSIFTKTCLTAGALIIGMMSGGHATIASDLLPAVVESRAGVATGSMAESTFSPQLVARGGSQGMASYYCCYFHGRTTASGERFNQYALTAAHRSLKFGTRVRVTNLNNGKSVVVKINDRGPFVGGRVIDLSLGAAQAIGMVGSGVAPVSLQIL